MFKRPCLAAVIGSMLFVVSAAVPGKGFAVPEEFAAESATPSDTASVNTDQKQYAARGGGRGGRGGRTPKSKPSSTPESKPSSSPGSKPSSSPGAGPSGGSPGSKPSDSPRAGSKGSGGNVNVNRNVNVEVKHRGHGWRGTRWGAVVFGVTLGTAIVVVANTPPPPPAPSLCWTWTNAALTSGYWYYCEGP